MTGLVQNPTSGRPVSSAVAVVYLFDAQGRYFASGRVALDQPILQPGNESPFSITVAAGATVSRYRIGFRREDGAVVSHVDRRSQAPAGTTEEGTGSTSPDAGAARRPEKRGGLSRMRTHSVPRHQRRLILAIVILATLAVVATDARQERPTGQGFSFRTAVELINVTVTVTDEQGRFVSGLHAEDFEVYEDGKLQTISQFDSERVPVSLGIALDTSGSMVGEKIAAAQSARSIASSSTCSASRTKCFSIASTVASDLVSGWTDDRRRSGACSARCRPNGGTAMYDTVADAVPLAQRGTRRKKALVADLRRQRQNSRTSVDEVRQLIREIGSARVRDRHRRVRRASPLVVLERAVIGRTVGTPPARCRCRRRFPAARPDCRSRRPAVAAATAARIRAHAAASSRRAIA